MVRLRHALILAAALTALPAFAQTPAGAPDSMQMLRNQLAADKKLLVTSNMDLTPAEAAAFWPLYDEYQRELQKLNERLATTITAYGRAYNARTLTDAQATAMMKEAMAVEDDESRLRQAMAQKLGGVLPGRKAVRYLQLENKVRALIKYEIAAEVPLVQ